MTDEEFQTLLRRNITLTGEYKANFGNPYVILRLETIPGPGEEVSRLGTVEISCDDLERVE